MGYWADVAAIVNGRMADQGMSQRELAERSGVSPATVRKIQHGDEQARNRSTLTALSRALGLPDDHLWQVAVSGQAPEPAAGEGADGPLRLQVAELERRVSVIEERLRIAAGEGGRVI